MKLSEFSFDLPDELIARFPTEQRDASRLLHIDSNGNPQDRQFRDLMNLLSPNDCLIFNNTKVIPARLLGHRASGGKVEVLVERIINDQELLAMVRSSNSLKPQTELHFGKHILIAVERVNQFYRFKVEGTDSIFDVLESEGHMPLPPYIDRLDTDFDKSRYQTVYAEKEGAVAAPTAGLHFTDDILAQLNSRGIETDFVTLHVGSGTFAPVRVDDIESHEMHSEWFEVPESVVALVNRTKARGGRVIAVGTTSVRSLESASFENEQGSGFQLKAMSGDTSIFIYPGYQFKCVDGLITNFHLPESTLIMLVSALAGKEVILNAYQHAVEQKYRFFSYGDAMFIESPNK
ncbi:MAG: tRNA preQ1(34) S-adenosylmethionine ribosyltransferase-isomerase QueA [Gammaproteobacteria bacterium]|nr:tRNA preQ1(34) S-adenosylmethionine ribosyltransferase-isomerase QueA [Gammaproteobacteria bacterium]